MTAVAFAQGAFAQLAAALRARPAEADRVARGLAPDGPGPGRRFQEGPGARPVAYQQRFRGVDELAALVDAGHAGAVELAVELLAELDPQAAVEPAAALLPAGPGPGLGAALGRALGRAGCARSFALLVAHGEVPSLRDGLRLHAWPGGVAAAWALVDAADLGAADLDPRQRVRAVPALAYLLRHDRARALAAAEALLASPAVNADVAHLLLGVEPEGPALLLRELQAAPPGERLRFSQVLAVKVLLERDPTAVVDALGGEAALAVPGGRPRLRELVQWLRVDTWAKPQHGGSRGWLGADPRFARLLQGLTADPDRELAGLARDLLKSLPPELRPRAPRAKKAAPPAQAAPDPTLLAELEALRASLERLVAHLRASGYRFAAPRAVLVPPRAADLAALARLEKQVVVPPALASLWRTVGSVDLRGQDPAWPAPAFLGFPGAREPVWCTDPLVIGPAARVIGEALEAGDGPPLSLALAPDALGAAGYSAGARSVHLPQPGADPAFDGGHGSLLDHLRRAAAWGGFPGFAAIAGAPAPWVDAARRAWAG
jgi:hypothetical protein